MFQRVLVPLDDSPLSGRMLEAGVAIARAFEARLSLLKAYNWSERFAMVDTPTVEVVKDEGHTEEEQARAFLEERAVRLREAGLTVDTVVLDASPARAILDESEREPGTLLVIGTHERGWLARLLKGSTLQDVLHDVQVPMLIIREGS